VIGLGLRSAAYQSEIFRGAIQSIPPSQMRASRSLGMTKMKGFRSVIFPQAFRVGLPPWANEFTIVLKDSSFAFALGVTELLREGNYIIATTYEPVLIFLTIAAIYFIICMILNKGLAVLEQKLSIPGFEIREKIK
jgi:polar amino acid transport system permease protein